MSLALAHITQVEQVRDDAALDALRDSWNCLAGEIPFRRFEWLVTWWRHYRQPNWKLFVVTVRDADDELIGLAPWYLSHSKTTGRLLRFLGSGEVCTDHLTLLAAEGCETTVAADVANYLAEGAADQWDSLELIGLDAEDPNLDLLADHLEIQGYDVHRRAGLNCWRLEFPDTWNELVASLSKTRREKVRKLLRRNFQTGRVTTGLVTQPEELDKYFALLVELHQKRRNSLGQSGSFASERFFGFHHDVMRQFLPLGLLRLWWTNLDGQPAAIEYDLIGGDTVFFYQSGIEPALAKRCPGWLGAIGSLREAHRQGFRYFDFLRGDEAYKASWNATVQPAIEIRIVAPRTLPRLRYAAWNATHMLRRCLKFNGYARRQKNKSIAGATS